MLKILNILGTRPEAIKMAPVIKNLEKHENHFCSFVCVTGQHREMLDQVLDIFKIRPDFDLNIMLPDQTLSQLTSNLFSGLDPVVKKTKPDYILAQGDTTSALVAAFVSFYAKIPFCHVEAGLRTSNLDQPFPEEMNRRLVDNLSALLFAPTKRNRQVLLREGFSDEKILVTGNTVIDALLEAAEMPYDWSAGPLAELEHEEQLVLVTAHRRESFGAHLKEICYAVKDLALKLERKGVHFVFPVHMNPNVRQLVEEILSGISNISLINPTNYLSFVHLMKKSKLIMTDSGGIQEEAPSLGIPVLVMRDVTERPEGVEAGISKVVGTERARIFEEAMKLLLDPAIYTAMANIANPYGDGKAAQRIVSFLLEYSQ